MIRWIAGGFLAVLFCLSVMEVQAQLSPGDLSKAHAILEGVENCTKCHGSKREVVADNCMKCHSAIRASLTSQTGMHGKQQYKECQLCHVEHQGREFALIYWKQGEKNFDHALTGYQLEGKHTSLECRMCHQSKFIVDTMKLIQDKTALENTFLGLSSECKSCHFDEHRGQMVQNCNNCHTTDTWKPTVGFNHSKTEFPLTGKHANVLCAKCHVTKSDGNQHDDGMFAQFASIAHSQCTDCHTDIHNGKLGANCTSCHSTEGWHLTDKATFDHDRTRYPLFGKHAAVTCDKCHIPGRERTKLQFDNCQDCHADFHKEEFAARSSKGACEECHTVNGFSPSLFTMTMHDSSDYPLTGAHQAVPCVSCHVEPMKSGREKSLHFKFTSTQCQACHTDPHRGEVAKFVNDKGCEFCHAVESWQQVQFDHHLTTFALEGKHGDVACRKCHAGDINDTQLLTFLGALEDCQSCHSDVHAGQFATTGASDTDCQKCHSPKNWKDLTFSHSQGSRFKLDGAHEKVPCAKCHYQTSQGNQKFVLYKPLESTCASCHGADNRVDKEKKS